MENTRKIYEYAEAKKLCLEYFKGEELSATVFLDKYALKDRDQNLLEATPDEMFDRLSSELYRIEKKKFKNPLTKEEIYEYIKGFNRIVLQGSPMAGIGNDYQYTTISNCYVVDSPLDSYSSICRTDEEIISISKRRGGCGLDLSNLRPAGSSTTNAARSSTGVIPFAERYSNTIREVGQCLHKDTLILTIDGLKKISDIKSGDKVWTQQEWVEVKKVIKNKKSCLKIKTQSGKEVICSKEHTFHTVNGEKKAENFIEGDLITQVVGKGWEGTDILLYYDKYNKSEYNNSNRLREDYTLPAILDEKLAYILGNSYGDGYVGTKYKNKDNYSLSFSCSDIWEDIKIKLKKYVKDVFNHNICVKKYKDSACENYIIHSRLIVDFLEKNNILKQKAADLIFPQILLKANKNIIFSFLSGFFDADGSVVKSKKVYKITSISENFILMIQNILSSYGIISRIHKMKRENIKWSDIYTLVVNGQKSQDIFRELMSESIKIKTVVFKSKIRDCSRTTCKIGDFNSKSYKHPYILDRHQYISYSTSDRLKKDLNIDKQIYLLQDKVSSISIYDNNKEQDVYDLCLEKEHLFFANGLYAHNSGRRGALMISLSVHHPEVVDFARCKRDLNKVTGANISIRLTDEFLNAVKNNTEYEQRFPVECKNGEEKKISKMVDARGVWNKIIENAWACVDYNTEIDVFKDGDLVKYKIGDFYDEFNSNKKSEYEILSLNLNSQRIEKKKIIKAQEYLNNKKTYKIVISGSELIVTEDHIFYKLSKNGDMVSSPIKDIMVGDKIAFSKKNEFGKKQYVNLYEIMDNFNDNGYSLSGENIIKLLDNQEVKKRLGKYDCNDEHKTTYYKRIGYLPIKEYFKIRDIVNFPLKNTYFRISRNGHKFPVEFEINKDICAFLGLWLAEGSYNSSGNVRLHIHREEFQYYKNLFDSISTIVNCNYSYYNINNYCCVDFNSSFLKRFIVGIGLKKYLCTKEIPNFLFLTTKENISAFLRGLFSGDGTVDKRGNISFSQSNREIIYNVYNLLLKFGIHSHIRLSSKKGFKIIKGENCTIKDSYNLNIYSHFNNIFKEEIGFLQKNKQDRLSLNSCKHSSNIFEVPIDLNKELIQKTVRRYQTDYIKESSVKNHLILMQDEKINKFLNSDIYYLKLSSKEEIRGIETVYDITVKDNHTFILSNGIILSNSAEPGLLFWSKIISESPADCYSQYGFASISVNPCAELVLCSNDSCRLLVLNLFSYVKNPFTKDAYFDFEFFKADAKIAQRFMDDIVDIELEKIEAIIKKIKSDPETEDIKRNELEVWKKMKVKCSQGRRTGTGLTALGDTFAALGIKYGSQESIEMTKNIYKTMKLSCYRFSVEMAKELGPFEIWDYELEKNNPFLLRIKDEDPELYEDMKKYGRRNIAILTAAPSGSISIETQTTSGIEPLFQISHTRKKKINPNDKSTRVDSVDQNGDSWQHFEIFHPKVKMWMEITGEKDIKKSPWYGCCAEEINWENRVKLQATANQDIDHSIASTVNLPENVSVQEVAKIYETAWSSGCKGITIYRKNSRTGVLVDNKENKKEKIIKTKAPKRPVILPAEIYYVTSKGEPYFVIVGLLGEDPYEVFAGKEKGIFKKISIKKGLVKKISRGRYSLLEENGELVVEDICKKIDEDQEAITRLISASLRHGCDASFIVHQLEKVEGDMLSFAKALSRVMKKYIADGVAVHGETCIQCGGNNLKRSDGCRICFDCGYSRC